MLPSRFQKVDIIRKWCPSEMAAYLGDFFAWGSLQMGKNTGVGEALKNAINSHEN